MDLFLKDPILDPTNMFNTLWEKTKLSSMVYTRFPDHSLKDFDDVECQCYRAVDVSRLIIEFSRWPQNLVEKELETYIFGKILGMDQIVGPMTFGTILVL